MDTWRESLLQSFLDCDREAARGAMEGALAAGVSPQAVALELIQPTFDALGDMWAQGGVTLTQIFVAARATEETLDALAGRMQAGGSDGPRVVLGTLIDGHGLGARLVGIFLRAAGMQVVEAGTQASAEDLVARAVEAHAQVLAVSVLMLRSAKQVSQVCELRDVRAPMIKVAAGGAPFRADPGLAQRVGVDGWAPDALSAVAVIRSLATDDAGKDRAP